jgi:hypothetical protein
MLFLELEFTLSMEPVRDRKVAKRRVQSPTSGNQLFFENREEEGGNAEIYLERDLPCLLRERMEVSSKSSYYRTCKITIKLSFLVDLILFSFLKAVILQNLWQLLALIALFSPRDILYFSRQILEMY